MSKANPSPDELRELLTEAAGESLRYLTKAFRGGVDLEDGGNRSLLRAASSTVGSWSSYEATQSSREMTRFAMARALANEEGKSVSDMMKITMPQHSVARQLSAGNA